MTKVGLQLYTVREQLESMQYCLNNIITTKKAVSAVDLTALRLLFHLPDMKSRTE